MAVDYMRTKADVDAGQLHMEITDNGDIPISCVGVTHYKPDSLKIEFAVALSGAEEAELNTEIGNHVPA